MPLHDRISLPYAHLNLRCNPFGSLSREEKNKLIVLRIELSPYIERLREPGFAVQFLREGARNKTTHLLAIQKHFPGAPYIRLYEGQPAPQFPQSPILFIDWFHALPRVERAGLLRRKASFAIVSHLSHEWEFRRAQLDYDLVKLPVYTVEQLTHQINRRINWAKRNPDIQVPTLSAGSIARLRSRFDDDTAIINYLYEVFEDLVEVGTVEI